ncbi:MAG: hypothetical protein ACYC69_02815 [Thermodesulfovibrionales bacterium]
MSAKAYPFIKKHISDLYWFGNDHHVETTKEIAGMTGVPETIVERVLMPYQRMSDTRSRPLSPEWLEEMMARARAISPLAADIVRAYFLLFLRQRRKVDALDLQFRKQDPELEAGIEKEMGWFIEVFLPAKKKDGTPFTVCWYPPIGLKRDRMVASRLGRYIQDRLRPRAMKAGDEVSGDITIVVHEWTTVTSYSEGCEEDTRVVPRYLLNWHWVFGHAEYLGRKAGVKPGQTEVAILREMTDEIERRCPDVVINDTKTKFGDYIVYVNHETEAGLVLGEIEAEFRRRYPMDIFCIY